MSDIADALSHVPSDDRDLWVRMGMAVKSELGDAGFDIWDSWSQTADNYRPGAARSVWRSINEQGGVTIRSLYAEARSAGWSGEGKADLIPTKPRTRPTEDPRPAERAAKRAQSMIDQAVTSRHDYLARKGFPNHTALVLDGLLLVPMRHPVTNDLRSLQTISIAGEKRFLRGGKASGSALVLGKKNARETFLCEGYATALSIQAALKSLYATSRVVVCFSAGNIPKIAQLLQGDRFVVADHDESGTGQRYAEKTGLPWWMPPESGDANDFHQGRGLVELSKSINELRR